MPELPEVQAHAERLSADYTGRVLKRFQPLRFTALKTAVPPPNTAYGQAVTGIGRRGKFLLLDFETVQFAVHLMQGGRLLVDPKQAAKPRGGQARFVFDEGPALLLTEAGTERRAGVWVYPAGKALSSPPLNAQEAFVTGRIRFFGDQQLLIDSQSVFAALDGVFAAVRERTQYE